MIILSVSGANRDKAEQKARVETHEKETVDPTHKKSERLKVLGVGVSHAGRVDIANFTEGSALAQRGRKDSNASGRP